MPLAVSSLTKTFVVALILQLSEEGEFRLVDRLTIWLPKYPRAKKVTVRMLWATAAIDHCHHLPSVHEQRPRQSRSRPVPLSRVRNQRQTGIEVE